MRLAPLLLAGAVAANPGCSLARSVTGQRVIDGNVVDDVGIGDPDVGEPDGGITDDVGVDAATDDTGGPCVARCEANTAITCNLGREARVVCDGMVCDDTGAYPMCLPLVCAPGTSACSADDTSSDTCNALGTATVNTHCDRGCTAGACRPEVTCGLVVERTIATSTSLSVDLCMQLNDNDDASAHGDCPTAPANGEDVIYRLDLDRTLHVVITARDGDGARFVDPIIYLRSACATRSSEIDCNDDGGSGRDARLDEVLTPGEYFLIVDSFDETGSGAMSPATCGVVDLSVTIAPL